MATYGTPGWTTTVPDTSNSVGRGLQVPEARSVALWLGSITARAVRGTIDSSMSRTGPISVNSIAPTGERFMLA